MAAFSFALVVGILDAVVELVLVGVRLHVRLMEFIPDCVWLAPAKYFIKKPERLLCIWRGGYKLCLAHENGFDRVTYPSVPTVTKHDDPHLIVRVTSVARVTTGDIEMVKVFAGEVGFLGQALLKLRRYNGEIAFSSRQEPIYVFLPLLFRNELVAVSFIALLTLALV
jgi:hypothetical protein